MEKGTYKPAYRDLNAYITANDLVLLIYKSTKKLPKDELFGLTSQMRRCAVSVPANIVEGYGRHTAKDKLHFYYIARGSLNELEYYIELIKQLEYINDADYEVLSTAKENAGKTLAGLIKSMS